MDQEILSRLLSMEESTGLALNSYEKSLRAYTTKVHPLFMERMVMTGNVQSDISTITSTRSYTYGSTDQGFKGNALMNFIFQPLFDQEEPEYNQIIYLQCSSRTTGPESFGSTTMDLLIGRELSIEPQSLQTKAMELRDLCYRHLGWSVTMDLLQEDYSKTTLCREIERFLAENDYSFPASVGLHIPSRCLPPDLVMDSKFYLTRNDDRAFCKDRSILRHLTGCCLHRLFLPKQMYLRVGLDRNQVLPAYDKDLLNLVIPRHKHCTSRIIVSDISNFTGSAANSWLMLHCMNLQLSAGASWDKHSNVYCVKGSLLTATWKDIISVYLYHTVGVPCIVPGQDELGYLPGGFLGVAANITIGLVMLSVVLENLKRILQPKLSYIQFQAGGDDNCVGLVGSPEDVEDATILIRKHLESYVGPIKEFTIIDLEDHPIGCIPKLRFCKKRVFLNKSDVDFSVIGEPSIPIPACLSTSGYLTNVNDQEKAWRTLHLDLNRYETKLPHHGMYADTIRARFLQLYPHCLPARHDSNHKVLSPLAKWTQCGRYRLTEQAMGVVMSLADITVGEATYLDSMEERIRHTLVLGLNLKVTVLRGNLTMDLIVKRNQRMPFTRQSQTDLVGIIPDFELLKKIVNIYM